MRTSKTRVANNFQAPEFSVLTQPVIKLGRGMSSGKAALRGMGTYNKAALRGMGTYNKAALRGMGTYNKAALRGMGGKTYTKAASVGMGAVFGRGGKLQITLRGNRKLGKYTGGKSFWETLKNFGVKIKESAEHIAQEVLPKALEKAGGLLFDTLTDALDGKWDDDKTATEKWTKILKETAKDTMRLTQSEMTRQSQGAPLPPPRDAPAPMEVDDEKPPPLPPRRPAPTTKETVEEKIEEVIPKKKKKSSEYDYFEDRFAASGKPGKRSFLEFKKGWHK